MKLNKLLIVVAVLAILLSGYSTPAAVRADWSKVDQGVLDQIDANGSAGFHVIMAVQADLSGAAKLASKVEKTTYVYNLLTRTAAETQAPLLAQLKAEGVTYRSYYIYNMIEVTADRSTVEWLASRPEVARIVPLPSPQKEPVFKETLFGPPVPDQKTSSQSPEAVEWNITRVGAPDVWGMGFHGEGMVVAGNDTGVDYTHPALVGKYRGNLGGGTYNHNYNWWGGAGSMYPVDGDGHGTHTMGTMVGDDGGSNQIGMAPGAQWIACAGLGGADTLECFEFFLAPWDLNHQNPDPSMAPDSINNSWYDSSGYDYRPIIQALNAAGIAVIKSAGNNGPGCSTISNPGYVPEIIATAAFAQGDTIASFSSRGPMSNYGGTILKPEVAAPGVNVRSSVPGGGYEGGWSGTSMAAPHSTGLVALIWSAAPCIQGNVPLTKQIMMETAEAKIDAQCPPFVDHPNDVWGWGILDAPAAVTVAMGYCSGMGGIEGTVTSSSSPVEGVEVEAVASGGWTKTEMTDPDGFYAMAVFSDTYTVTATKYGYQTMVVPDVEVTADVTVTLDIDMPALPEYTVSGYVREMGSNTPLSAVVEILDAPVPPVNTDPATGFYSIDIVEGTWTMQATAANHAPQTVIVDVTGNLQQDFSLSPFCDVFADDVESGNMGWTAQAPWGIVTESSHSPTHSWTDSPGGSYQNNVNTSLTSPLFDLTGYTGMKLNYWQTYATESSYDYCYVEYSTNGGSTWTNAATFNGTNMTWTQQEIPLPQLDGQANARIRFHFTSDVSIVYDGWHVDDITLIGGGPGCVPPDDPITGLAATSTSPDLLGETTTFTATITGGTNVIYEWDFGDGSTGSGAVVSHEYLAADFYTAVVTATNNNNSATATTVVEITDVPISGLTATNDSPTLLGETTTFTATVTGGTNVMYEWDFGDGATATGKVVTHVYETAGSFPAMVTATNSLGSDEAETVAVIVPPYFYTYLPIVSK